MFDGKMPIIHANRALMNLEAGRITEALDSARYAVSISADSETDPAIRHGYIGSRIALAMVSATAGHAGEAVASYDEILSVDPKHPLALPNSCFIQTLNSLTPKDLLSARRRWREANAYTGEIRPYDNDRNPDRPLRIGYVGGDFKRHSAAMIFGGVLLHHTPAVLPYFYSSLPVDPNSDDMTRRFRAAAGDRWREIHTFPDDDAAALIRRDRIDILVDLAGHTNGGRLAIFLRKPAPIQATAWGFAHGTGLSEIDYFLADPVAVQPAEHSDFAESVIDLPCIVTYLPPSEYNLKGKSVLPYHSNECITFGSYARYEKLSDACLSTFAEILRRVPDSRLQFKDHAFLRPYSIDRVRRAMPDIDPKRLLFSISTSHPEHLLAMQQCDLSLDPWPHGGGVVTMETLYMGVPIITLYGSQPAGRSAASVLTAMNHADWIAQTPSEYVEKAVALAGDISTLNKVRKTLRDELLQSPVCAGYVGAVESAYRSAWKKWCES